MGYDRKKVEEEIKNLSPEDRKTIYDVLTVYFPPADDKKPTGSLSEDEVTFLKDFIGKARKSSKKEKSFLDRLNALVE